MYLRRVAVPDSKTNRAICQILYREGFVAGLASGDIRGPFHTGFPVPLTPDNVSKRRLWVDLKYRDGKPVLTKMQVVSKPSRRVYATVEELKAVAAGRSYTGLLKPQEFGQATVIDTEYGILELKEALSKNVGGEVFDVGCGEGSLISILLNSSAFTKLHGLDILESELQVAVENCTPTMYDYRFLREKSIDVSFYQGGYFRSVDDVDDRFYGFDAITSLEVIEHLPALTLSNFPKTVFGTYKPRIVILSTPNAEFNVNFKNLNYGTESASFRHWDHKFEWNRIEFEDWCNAIGKEYNYTTNFTGVGTYKNSKTVGFCSQFCTFERNFPVPSIPQIPNNNEAIHPYKLFSRIEFPYYDTVHTLQERTDLVKTYVEELVYDVWCYENGVLMSNEEIDAAEEESRRKVRKVAYYDDSWGDDERNVEFDKRKEEQVEQSYDEDEFSKLRWPIPNGVVKIRFSKVWDSVKIRQVCHGEIQELIEVFTGSDLFKMEIYKDTENKGIEGVLMEIKEKYDPFLMECNVGENLDIVLKFEVEEYYSKT
ncbi:Small RNA 2'-O-methyltransferase [Nowakowskiella sp. JEL0407]|nr:Small RNA 2'-O-methyltransferase [Nowakowskiella sp. JEL0407]